MVQVLRPRWPSYCEQPYQRCVYRGESSPPESRCERCLADIQEGEIYSKVEAREGFQLDICGMSILRMAGFA